MNKKILGIMSLVTIGGLCFAPLVALATQAGTDITVSPQAPPAYTSADALKIITTIINYAFGFILAIAVLMLIFAAYLYITGGSNPEQVGKANKMLMYALIGIAVAVVVRGLIALVGVILGKTISV